MMEHEGDGARHPRREYLKLPFTELVTELIKIKDSNLADDLRTCYPTASPQYKALTELYSFLLHDKKVIEEDVLFNGVVEGTYHLNRVCESFLDRNFYSTNSVPKIIIIKETGTKEKEEKESKPLSLPRLESREETLSDWVIIDAVFEGVHTAKSCFENIPQELDDTMMVDKGLYAEAKLRQAWSFMPSKYVAPKGQLYSILKEAGVMSNYLLTVYPKIGIEDVLKKIGTEDEREVLIQNDGSGYGSVGWIDVLNKLSEGNQ